MSAIESFNNAIKQSARIAKVTKSSIKTLDSNFKLIHVETEDGLRLNVKYSIYFDVINASNLISQLIHTDKKVLNKRIARWMRTKEGLWAIDSLCFNSAPWNEHLAFEYKDNTLWEYDINDFDDSRVYKPEFCETVMRDNLYDVKTNYFNLKPVQFNGARNKFWIVNERYDNELFDCYCCYEILLKLFERFNVWVDDALINVIKFVYNESYRDVAANQIKRLETDKEECEFFIKDNGELGIRANEKTNHWHNIEQRGFEPVHVDEYNIWSEIVGYRKIGSTDSKIYDKQRVETDPNFTVANCDE